MIKKCYIWLQKHDAAAYAAEGRYVHIDKYFSAIKRRYDLTNLKFELIHELLPQTFFYCKEKNLTFWISDKFPSCSYVQENYRLITTDYNKYWAELNDEALTKPT